MERSDFVGLDRDRLTGPESTHFVAPASVKQGNFQLELRSAFDFAPLWVAFEPFALAKWQLLLPKFQEG